MSINPFYLVQRTRDKISKFIYGQPITSILYFDFIPKELIYEILYYTDYQSTINIDELYPRLRLGYNKLFWIDKIKRDGLEFFLEYIYDSDDNDYLEDYKLF